MLHHTTITTSETHATRLKFSVSLSKLLVQEPLTGNSEATAHVLFCSKFVVPDKAGTRMYEDRLAKLPVRDSGTSNLVRELGSCAIGQALL